MIIAESQAGAGDGGSILIKNGLNEVYGSGIEQIVFASGTAWSQAEVLQKLLAQSEVQPSLF